MIRDLLKPFGKSEDNCMVNLLSYMHGHKGEWINKAALALLQLPYFERGVKKHFSAETITRKLRDLASYGLIERKEVKHQACYRWPESQEIPPRVVWELQFRDGRPIRVPILTHE